MFLLLLEFRDPKKRALKTKRDVFRRPQCHARPDALKVSLSVLQENTRPQTRVADRKISIRFLAPDPTSTCKNATAPRCFRKNAPVHLNPKLVANCSVQSNVAMLTSRFIHRELTNRESKEFVASQCHVLIDRLSKCSPPLSEFESPVSPNATNDRHLPRTSFRGQNCKQPSR